MYGVVRVWFGVLHTRFMTIPRCPPTHYCIVCQQCLTFHDQLPAVQLKRYPICASVNTCKLDYKYLKTFDLSLSLSLSVCVNVNPHFGLCLPLFFSLLPPPPPPPPPRSSVNSRLAYASSFDRWLFNVVFGHSWKHTPMHYIFGYQGLKRYSM